MRATQIRGSNLDTAPRCESLVGDGGARVFRLRVRKPRAAGSRPGQRPGATCGLGGRASGLVLAGGGAGGGGMADPTAPAGSEEICFRGRGQASVGARALRVVCRRALSSGPGTRPPMRGGGWAAVDTRGRCDYAGPHAARRRAPASRSVSNSEDIGIRAAAYSGSGRGATACLRSLPRRHTLGIRRCAQVSLGFGASASSLKDRC